MGDPSPYTAEKIERIRVTLRALARPDDVVKLWPARDLENLVRLQLLEVEDAGRSYKARHDVEQDPVNKDEMKATLDKYRKLRRAFAQEVKRLDHIGQQVDELSDFDKFWLAFASNIVSDTYLEEITEHIGKLVSHIELFDEICANAIDSISPPRHRERDYLYHELVSDLIFVGKRVTGRLPTYSKSDRVTGPWIDFLMAAIKPLRPDTTPEALADMVERFKKMHPEAVETYPEKSDTD